MTEKNLADCVSKKIRIYFKDGDELEGQCFHFTKALDNDPEIASISVDTPHLGAVEVYQNEIKSISLVE